MDLVDGVDPARGPKQFWGFGAASAFAARTGG